VLLAGRGVDGALKVEAPLRLGLGNNTRESWRARSIRVKYERFVVGLLLKSHTRRATPCIFILTRIAPSSGLDDDNLAGSWKAGRDAIAEWMGVDDKHRHIVAYEYRNERGPWGVRIECGQLG
jgi:hypothetical protein